MTEKETLRLSKLKEIDLKQNVKYLAGIDEAGRGPLAGPVVVGIVIMPKESFIEGINDSKKVSEKKREKLYDEIIKNAIDWSVGIVDEKEIDKVNILNATKYEAKIIGTDPETDLAVIKIDKTNLTAAKLGNSDKLKVGEFVMAIGNPLGMHNSVTAGIVSAINREVVDDDGSKFILIQTDAAINAGNSGGALVNGNGEIVGINTLKLSGTGIEGMGFAIPINSTISIYEQLIQYNKVKRPYIGITGLDLDEATAKKYNLALGIYVRSIDDFSAGQKAGLKAGDVIIQADGKDVKTMADLNAIKNTHKIGDEMKLRVSREGKEIEITITLAEQE